MFLDWVPRRGETQLSLMLASAVNIQPSHFDPTTSTGTGETVQMDVRIHIHRHERYEANEMNGDVYVDGLGDATWTYLFQEANASAFEEESGCLTLRDGDGCERDGKAVGHKDGVAGRMQGLDSDTFHLW